MRNSLGDKVKGVLMIIGMVLLIGGAVASSVVLQIKCLQGNIGACIIARPTPATRVFVPAERRK